MKEDNLELNQKMLQNTGKRQLLRDVKSKACSPVVCDEPREKDKKDYGVLTQWTSGDGIHFIPAGGTIESLPPGAYEIHSNPCLGLNFQKINIRTEGLLRFPQTNSERVLKEIETFWEKEQIFKEYNLTHKRGIILYGPPGSGKTCLVNLIMKDVIDRKGIVIKFLGPNLFLNGMRVLREVEPKTPVVVLMEDIDSIIERESESEVLNILDGVESISKIAFLATTNYPEMLGPRIINRPSRFDKRFKIPHPNEESREIYLLHLCGQKPEELKINIKRWVKDTDGFSIAHLKELFVAVIILGDDYEEALDNLKLMCEDISSKEDHYKYGTMGFVKTKNVGCDDGCGAPPPMWG